MARIPLIEDLTSGPIPAGSNLLVEFDPSSQWYNAHVSIAAGWLQTGGKVMYHIAAQPPERVRDQLKRLGIDNVEELERDKERPTLALNDWYSATLSPRKYEDTDDFTRRFGSLKAADLSINWAKGEELAEMRGLLDPLGQPALRIVDNASSLTRFNDERTWIEFILTRLIPRATKWKQFAIVGLIEGLHSEWVYKTLEGASDGVIDFRIEEKGEETRDVMRIRSMRNVGFDRKWHQLKFNEKFWVTLEK